MLVSRFFYLAKTKLGMSEAEAWMMTPRKFLLLWDTHLEFTGQKKPDEYAIDMLP